MPDRSEGGKVERDGWIYKRTARDGPNKDNGDTSSLSNFSDETSSVSRTSFGNLV
jgi:hypothetical protein